MQNLTAASHKSDAFPLQLTKASRLICTIKRLRQCRLSRYCAETSPPFFWPSNWHELHFVITLEAQCEGQGMEIKKATDLLELKQHWKDSKCFYHSVFLEKTIILIMLKEQISIVTLCFHLNVQSNKLTEKMFVCVCGNHRSNCKSL